LTYYSTASRRTFDQPAATSVGRKRQSWCTSYSLDSACRRNLGDGDSASTNHQILRQPVSGVTKLAKKFELGEMDRVGPLKLYHTQANKRELMKVCANNQGGVYNKAMIFEPAVDVQRWVCFSFILSFFSFVVVVLQGVSKKEYIFFLIVTTSISVENV
jgi:hypothetical protein